MQFKPYSTRGRSVSMKNRFLLSVLTAVVAVVASSAQATLLGIHIGYPLITYQNISTTALTYNTTTDLFSINASPAAIQFSASESPTLVSGIKSFQIRVLVDHTGLVVGGVPGDDLVLTGTVVRGTTTYTGVLLTGEVSGFGYVNSGTTDQYDLRFTPTGGLLFDLFSCGDEGVQVTSEASTFNDTFNVNFNGRAKGNVGLVDSQPPSIFCPYGGEAGGTNVVECQGHANGLPGAYVSFAMPVVTDNCDTNPSISFDPPSGSFFPLPDDQESADYVVIVTARDAAGNTNTCPFVVRIQDTLPPDFADTSNPIIDSCDANDATTLPTDAGKCYATYTFPKPSAIDNCCPSNIDVTVSAIDKNGTVIPLSDLGNGNLQGQFPLTLAGTNFITTTARDGRGNTAQHQCPVFVVDTEPPSITCPTNQTIECTGGAVFFEEPVVTDNCCVQASCTPTNGSSLGVGTHLIACTAIDCSGNSTQCVFYVTIQDTVGPKITCPGPITIECDQSSAPSNTGTATAIDTCDNSPRIIHSDALSGSCPQTLTRTWTAIDYAGNSNSCTQIITIEDTNKPAITCPDPLTVQCLSDVPAPDTNAVSASDNCGVVARSFVSDGYATNGCIITVTRTYKATDLCGNYSTCAQIITVANTNPPTVFSPGALTVGCVGDVPAPVTTFTSSVGSCGTGATSRFVSDSYATNGCTITVTRTYQATNTCGNSSTSTQTITVLNTNKPSITAPGPVSVPCFSNIPAPDTSGVSASAYCGGAVTKSFVNDSYATNACVITVTRTYKATDVCGNYATSPQTITVQNTNKPAISCPGPVNVQCFASVPAPDANSVNASAYCGGPVTKSFVSDSYATNGCAVTITRTYKATDACGLYSTCAQTLTFQNIGQPTIVCPTNIQCQIDGTQCASASVNVGLATATATCSTATVTGTRSDGQALGAAYPLGVTTITWKATDACGSSTCTQTVAVINQRSIAANFNGTAIAKNNTLWFNAAAKLAGTVPTNSNFYLCFVNSTITFTAGGSNYNLTVPNGRIAFSSSLNNTNATTTFNTNTVPNEWSTTVAKTNSGNFFVSGLAFLVPTNLPGSIQNVTWAGTFLSSVPNVTLNWQWAAAVGTNIPAATPAGYNQALIKPVDSKTAQYPNLDPAGTAEAFKANLRPGGTGNGGTNYTGSPSAPLCIITCTVPSPTGYVTYTPGGWGAPPNGNNVATLLTNKFALVYPSGFVVGGTYTVKCTTGMAIVNWLPDGTTPGVLKSNYTNPLTTTAGVFGSQVAALKLNVDFSKAGYLKIGLPNLLVAPGNKLAGQTVAQVLALATKVLGGTTSALPVGVTLSDLNDVCMRINGCFDGGLTNTGFLTF